jgi:purine-binding chemotaxis protein CheW
MSVGTGSRRELLGRLVELEDELRRLRRAVRGEVSAAPFPAGESLRVLCFSLEGDLYGTPIESVREVLRYVQLTRVSDVPACVVGLVNVRGSILPVVDARVRFGLAAREPRLGTAILLLEHGGRTAGLVVDRVLDVTTLDGGSLAQPKGAVAQVSAVSAIATVAQQIIQVVDVAMLLEGAEWDDVAEAVRLSERVSAGEGVAV